MRAQLTNDRVSAKLRTRALDSASLAPKVAARSGTASAPPAAIHDPPSPTEASTQATAPVDRDFVRIGRSRIEGTGVFAKRRIHRGARIIEYTGARVLADRLLAPADDTEPARIYTFSLSEAIVIDGARGGNASRFINHSCEPNCEAYAFDDRMYIYAMRNILGGEELTFDYRLAPLTGQRANAGPDEHACSCGAENCRGTMRRTERRI